MSSLDDKINKSLMDIIQRFCAPKPELKDNEYQCELCLGVFEKGWTDEEAIAEKEENGWGFVPQEHCAMVCDDCYNKIMTAESN